LSFLWHTNEAPEGQDKIRDVLMATLMSVSWLLSERQYAAQAA